MCGITGKIYFNKGKNIDPVLLRKMTDTITYRGPDDDGFYINKNIGLGHRRLAIIDLSLAGHQPMSNEDSTVWIVFNGEIYNFNELRPDLEKRGHRFRSHSDTETIIHLYEEYGEKCLQYLRGMFAFAIWDAKQQKLFLARDRVGKKPLKYYIGKDFIVFASELKALLKDPEVPREIDYEAIHHYLTFQYVPHPMTGFKGIQKLPPAHYLNVTLTGPKAIVSQPKRYWRLDYSKKLKLSENEWKKIIIEKLEEAVKIRMIADVPLGAFLSGGIDSSTIVALMAKNSSKPIKTFSIGFKEASHNELPYARLIADKFKTEHTEFIVEPKTLEILPTIIYHYEEPYADSSAIPTYYVSKLTRKHVTVALNGDGGDENFAGYPWYNIHKYTGFYSHIPAIIQKLIRGGVVFGAHFVKNTLLNRGVRFANSIGETPQQRYLRYISYFHSDEKGELYAPEFLRLSENYDSFDFLNTYFQEASGSDPIDQALYVDINSYLPDDLLVKVDIASMAVSLEGRSPFLDHEFMELCAAIPSGLKLKGLEKKYILKRAIESLIPHENIYRRKKGFGVPIEHWFRGDGINYVREMLFNNNTLTNRLFKKEAIEKILDEHAYTKINHSNKMWSLLTLEIWWQKFFNGGK